MTFKRDSIKSKIFEEEREGFGEGEGKLSRESFPFPPPNPLPSPSKIFMFIESLLPFFLVKGGWGGRIQAENARCPLFGERAFSIGVENRD